MQDSETTSRAARRATNIASRTVAGLRDGVRLGGSRPMRGSRAVRTTLRTLHLIAIAALYGGHVFDVAPQRLVPALIATIATGVAFMAFEITRAPIWLVQLRGVGTYAKIALLASVPVLWEDRVPILTIMIVIGTTISHMPGRYRYYSFLHRRVVEGGDRG